MADKEEEKKQKKPKTNKKRETVLEVNEITEETLKAEELEKEEERRKQKEKEDRLRKEKMERTLNKIFKGYDINNIVKFLMWIFFLVASIYVSFVIIRQSFSAPTLKIFITEETLQEESKYKLDKINGIIVNVDSFDVSVRESDTDEIYIRYSKKYDKKISIQKKDGNINVQEKNKIFKFVRFNSPNNAMVIELPKNYEGSLEIESKTGVVKIEKYKILEKEKELEEEQVEDFYKNFFNI